MPRPPALPMPAAPPRAAVLALVAALFVVLPAGCTHRPAAVETRQGTEFYRVSDAEPPEPPPEEGFAEITAERVEASLRRVTIRHATWMLFMRSDPKPLFADGQVAYLADVLARELPGLKPTARLGFRLSDPYKGLPVDVRIHPEGEFLVYRFLHLMRRPREGPGPEPPNDAVLETLSGQRVQRSATPTLYDPALQTRRVRPRTEPSGEDVF